MATVSPSRPGLMATKRLVVAAGKRYIPGTVKLVKRPSTLTPLRAKLALFSLINESGHSNLPKVDGVSVPGAAHLANEPAKPQAWR